VNGAIAGFGADDQTAQWILNDGSSRTFHQSPVAPLTVQTAQGILPRGAPFGEDGYTGSLAVAPNDVVVVAQKGNDHDVLAFPRGGGAKRTLATVAAVPDVAPLVVGTDVYVALFTGFARVPLSGEAPESVGVGEVYALAADERAVYCRTGKGVFARASARERGRGGRPRRGARERRGRERPLAVLPSGGSRRRQGRPSRSRSGPRCSPRVTEGDAAWGPAR
jgi:hypothetical protein